MAASIEEALVAWLENAAAVEPLIANPLNPGGYQVFKESIPGDATIGGTANACAIAYKVDSDERERSLSGVTGDKNARIILTLEAMTEAQLGALYTAIAGSPTASALDGLTAQQLGHGGINVWCQYAEIEDRPDDFVPSPHAADAGTFLDHLAVRIAYWSP